MIAQALLVQANKDQSANVCFGEDGLHRALTCKVESDIFVSLS